MPKIGDPKAHELLDRIFPRRKFGMTLPPEMSVTIMSLSTTNKITKRNKRNTEHVDRVKKTEAVYHHSSGETG